MDYKECAVQFMLLLWWLGKTYTLAKMSETKLMNAVSTLDESRAEASMNKRSFLSANFWSV